MRSIDMHGKSENFRQLRKVNACVTHMERFALLTNCSTIMAVLIPVQPVAVEISAFPTRQPKKHRHINTYNQHSSCCTITQHHQQQSQSSLSKTMQRLYFKEFKANCRHTIKVAGSDTNSSQTWLPSTSHPLPSDV